MAEPDQTMIDALNACVIMNNNIIIYNEKTYAGRILEKVFSDNFNTCINKTFKEPEYY